MWSSSARHNALFVLLNQASSSKMDKIKVRRFLLLMEFWFLFAVCGGSCVIYTFSGSDGWGGGILRWVLNGNLGISPFIAYIDSRFFLES